MRTCINRTSEYGGVLVGVLIIGVVVSTVLIAMVSLVTQEHRMLAKSTTWNSALPLAEAGLEEAMSHLRQVGVGPRSVNGWTLTSVTNVYLMRTNSEGIYKVLINGATPPLVTSTGLVWSARDSKYVARRIRANTKGVSYFMKAISAKQKINFSGQMSVDSYDSSNPLYNSGGVYDATKKKDKGDVATNDSTPGAITLGGQSTIYGSLATGPTGTISMGNPSQVAVGSVAYVNGGGTGIQTNKYSKDMNVAFPNVDEPYTWGSAPNGVIPSPILGISAIPYLLNGTNYAHTLVTGNHSINTLSLGNSAHWVVTGAAQLYVKTSVSIQGSITILPGASLQLYVQNGTVAFSGNGIRNATGFAGNFGLWCMTNVTSVTFSGDANFVGTVYAPNSILDFSGGGSNPLDFQGAAVAKSVVGSGKFNFHYDEQLQNTGLRNLQVVSWKEI
jgi:Tfp pilus assembly protein PilX